MATLSLDSQPQARLIAGFQQPGPWLSHGGPVLALGHVFSDSERVDGFRARLGYEMAAPRPKSECAYPSM